MTFKSYLDTPFVHQVYFKLADRTPQTREAFIQFCYQYLSGHEGMTRFYLGLRAVEMRRPVNDQGFDILMDMEFENVEYYNKYRQHERHERWITVAGSMATERRVFDSYVLPEPDGRAWKVEADH